MSVLDAYSNLTDVKLNVVLDSKIRQGVSLSNIITERSIYKICVNDQPIFDTSNNMSTDVRVVKGVSNGGPVPDSLADLVSRYHLAPFDNLNINDWTVLDYLPQISVILLRNNWGETCIVNRIDSKWISTSFKNSSG